jgi:hypothetical protein
MDPNELTEPLWRFAARVGKVVDLLPDTRPARRRRCQIATRAALPRAGLTSSTSWRLNVLQGIGQFEFFNF